MTLSAKLPSNHCLANLTVITPPHRSWWPGTNHDFYAGSYPTGPKGRHRPMRFNPRQVPRHGPCFWIESIMYWLQLGSNRHRPIRSQPTVDRQSSTNRIKMRVIRFLITSMVEHLIASVACEAIQHHRLTIFDKTPTSLAHEDAPPPPYHSPPHLQRNPIAPAEKPRVAIA